MQCRQKCTKDRERGEVRALVANNRVHIAYNRVHVAYNRVHIGGVDVS